MNRLIFHALLISACWPGVRVASSQEHLAPGTEVPAPSPGARFAAPVLLRSGEKLMGTRRLYPSPVLHDVNGDRRVDIVIGDLWGRFTVAPRLEGGSPLAFGPEETLLARDREPLDFENW